MSHTEEGAGGADQSNRLIAAALAVVNLADCTTFRHVERTLEPLTEALFAAACGGQAVDVEPVLAAIKTVGRQSDWVRTTLENAVEDGEALATIRVDALILPHRALKAAIGALEWERWAALHDDDLAPCAVASTIGHVAERIARRNNALMDMQGVPMNAAEAAWAAVEGAKRAHLRVGRSAWRYALDGAYRGKAARLDDEARA